MVRRSGSLESMRAAIFWLAFGALLCTLAQEDLKSTRPDGKDSAISHVLGTSPHTKFEWTPRTIFAAALACMCALLANSAGIGGGPFYVPLLNVVLGFDLKAATGLSHTIVATSAVASSIYGLIQTHPNDPSRPLVDFDVALTFIPALLLGVSFGVLLNVLVPDWLQTLLLTVLLLFVINKTVRKGITQWRQEQKAIRQKRSLAEHADLADDDEEEDGVLHEERFERNPSKKFDQHHSSVQQMQITLSHIWHRLPFAKMFAVVVLWAIFLVTQQLKSKYPNCTWQYFTIFAAQVIFLLGVTCLCIWYEAKQAERHSDDMDPELRTVILGGDSAASHGRRETYRRLARVVVVMAFAGFMAGLLGIGGALIFNPVLLQLGVQPQVTASTSVLMILFTSSAISLSFYFQGLLNTSYAVVIAPLCFVSSLIGVTLVGRIIRASGRVSIIVLLLSGLIIVGTVLTAVFGGIRAIDNIRNGAPIGFKHFCE
ncbi:Sulfite exporter TauE/SafE family protein 3 [Coccomyxa sp. Obi]|nr:Sulfite exporter TauE/SafE family protein 3 [Coccomyxa sp. Obi]